MTDYDDNDFKVCYRKIIETINSLSENNNEPLMIAAVLTTTGLSLYRSLLPEEDYDKMLEVMVEFKDEINSYQHRGYLN
jgi:hypothetical protein|tara:strand:- start:1142 stop:1378 length:237 start_codon:yes stop_codon:yes gene_type:complete